VVRVGAAIAFAAYLLNQRYGSGDAWMYETESVITMLLGLWMVNVVFALGHRLLNFKSSRVTYVNASLFIYLVHHPLTLFFGAYITPHIASNTLGFFTGLVFVLGWRSCSTKSICGSRSCASSFQENRKRKPHKHAAHSVRRVCFRSPVLACAGSEAADKDAWCLHRNRQRSPSLASVLATGSGKRFLRRSLPLPP
jgi:hypothetical protein